MFVSMCVCSVYIGTVLDTGLPRELKRMRGRACSRDADFVLRHATAGLVDRR